MDFPAVKFVSCSREARQKPAFFHPWRGFVIVILVYPQLRCGLGSVTAAAAEFSRVTSSTNWTLSLQLSFCIIDKRAKLRLEDSGAIIRDRTSIAALET